MTAHSVKRSETFDPRDAAAYGLSEAARYIKLPPATLRSWAIGRDYPRAGGVAQFEPLIQPPSLDPPLLSFWNLVEAHVLRSLRTEHGVSLQALRDALAYAERHLGIDRLLLSRKLRTQAGELFIERYGELINISASGQIAMRRMFEKHLKRIEWEDVQFPVRLYPFTTSTSDTSDRLIAIDPRIAFGRPIIQHAGISTQAIADRIDAGESVQELASDYGLLPREIEDAVLYERAA